MRSRKCARHDSNVRPPAPQADALSPELRALWTKQSSEPLPQPRPGGTAGEVRGGDALKMGVAAARRVALRRDEDVVAHRVELQAAERAAICRRLEASYRPNRVPLGRLERPSL